MSLLIIFEISEALGKPLYVFSRGATLGTRQISKDLHKIPDFPLIEGVMNIPHVGSLIFQKMMKIRETF